MTVAKKTKNTTAKDILTPLEPKVIPSIVDQFVDDFKNFSFNTIKLGDTFLTKGLLKGVSEEPLEWRLVECSKSYSTLIFDVSYYGILVAEMQVFPNENCRIQQK